MREELSWLIGHLHDEQKDYRSQWSPEQLLRRICTRLSGRVGRGGFKPDERFASYLADFRTRGDKAIESRGLWGRVEGQWFELAAASGYRAHRWWVPKLTGVIESLNDGSIIRYRLRAIQRRHLMIIGFVLAFGLLAIGISVNRFISHADVAGVLALALGGAFIGSTFLFVRIAAPIAMGMERYLKRSIDDLAGQ